MLSPPIARVLLLVGWDAADWQVIHPLLDAGLMPNLQRLVEGGVIGNLASLSPMLSPILWTSIATGKRAYAHGVRGFIEPLPDRSGVRPVGTRSRRCKALWNIVSQSGRRSVVCGWQASHPAEPVRGAMVSNLFSVPPGRRHAEGLADSGGKRRAAALAENLAELRVHPREIEAPPIQQLIPRAAELDQTDPLVRHRLGFLAQPSRRSDQRACRRHRAAGKGSRGISARFITSASTRSATNSCHFIRRVCRKSRNATSNFIAK